MSEKKEVIYRTITGKGLDKEEYEGYSSWRSEYRYFKKHFSILGDSISTLDKQTYNGYRVYYDSSNAKETGIYTLKDIWWGKVITFFGGELLENNSWSGSRVTRLPNSNTAFPSACGNRRTSMLHYDNTMPDVIMVFMGMNDWRNGVMLYPEYGDDQNEEAFSTAYDHTLMRVKKNYPNAEIFCVNLCKTMVSTNSAFRFNPVNKAGIDILEYNEVISNVVNNRDCKLIDVSNVVCDTIDGVHPNVSGMTTLASVIIRQMADALGCSYLECDDDKHEFVTINSEDGISKLICCRCGITKYEKVESVGEPKSEEVVSEEPKKKKREREIPVLRVKGSDNTQQTVRESVIVIEATQPIDEPTAVDEPQPIEEPTTVDEPQLIEEPTTVDEPQIVEEPTTVNEPQLIEEPTTVDEPQPIDEPTAVEEPQPIDEPTAVDEPQIIEEPTTVDEPQPIEEPTTIEQPQTNKVNEDELNIEMLKQNMSLFAQSGYRSNEAFEGLLKALSKAPMYVPYEVDMSAEPIKVLSSATSDNGESLGLVFLTISSNNRDFVPLFTSKKEVGNANNVKLARIYPSEYISVLNKMEKDIVINPFTNAIVIDLNTVRNAIPTNTAPTPVQNPTPTPTPTPVQNPTPTPTPTPVQNPNPTPVNTDTANDNWIGKVVNGCNIVSYVRDENSARVYVATNQQNGANITIKIIESSNPASTYLKEKAQQQQIMFQSTNSDLFPRVLGVSEENGYVFVVEEYVNGDTLENIINNKSPFDNKTAVSISKQICMALTCWHNMLPARVHGDISPCSVIVQPDMSVKVMFNDFISMANSGNAVTNIYSAPEISNGYCDVRSDIYSLGMVMYAMLTGVDVSNSDNQLISASEINPNINEKLNNIIEKCIQQDPNKRFKNCNKIIEILNGMNM